MKKTAVFLSVVLVLFACPSARAVAGTGGAGGSSEPARETAVEKPGPEFAFGLSGTLANSYNRGNLDTWFGELTGDPNEQVDQGSPAFFAFDAAMYMPVKGDAVLLGASAGVILPADHSLWGTELYFGGRQELVLDPMIFSVGMPIRFRLGGSGRFYGTVNPSMLMGWVTGTYTSSTTGLSFTASPGFGFGMSVEGEVMLSRLLGATCRFGIRALKTDLSFEDVTSSTGYSQPLLDNGEAVQADLGGSYMTIGVCLHL